MVAGNVSYRTYLADGTKTGGECGSWKLDEPQDEEIFGGLFLSILFPSWWKVKGCPRKRANFESLHGNQTLTEFLLSIRDMAESYDLLCCYFVSILLLFINYNLFVFYFTKKEGSINCSVGISNQTKKKGVNFQLVCRFAE